MSQHYVRTRLNDEDITVLLGWDRPLSGFFMVVIKPTTYIDENGDEWPDEDYLYSNLKFGLSNNTKYFHKKLVDMKIDMPEEIFQIVDNDGMEDMGNAVSHYNVIDGLLQRNDEMK